LFDLGSHEISLGDTIGVGTPVTVLRMLEAVERQIARSHLAGHFHDTFGMAVANVQASFDFGLRVFDSSVSGLGGCPYARGASGNVATEDLVYLLHGMGSPTGVDLERLVDTSAWISQALGREPGSKVTRALLAKRPLG
jgi:hydroxymethylglutaryl-CoA lyase